MHSKIQLALWIAHPVLQLAVAGIMYRRKLHRSFPVFFAYLVSQVVIFAVVFPTFELGHYARYFYVYWISQAISLAIGFKVIHEIFLDVFRPYHTLKDLGSVLFKWAGLVMLLVAGVVAAASPSNELDPLVQAVLTLQRCVRVVQCGLILFLLVFARYLGVSRKQHSFGIALGFGAFAGVELSVVALHAGGAISQVSSNLVNIAAYNCAIMIWFGYALMKSPSRDASANLLLSQRWDQSLTDLQCPSANDSLIPIFEGMVDRALSRGNGDPLAEDVVGQPGDSTSYRMSSTRGVGNLLSPHHLSSKY